MEFWSLDTVRSLPSQDMPGTAGCQFIGGMLDGQIRQLATTVNAGPLPFNGCNRGRAVRKVYPVSGWRPDYGVWIYALTSRTRANTPR